MMVFPGEKVDGKMTINGQRGCHPRIKDRFDLTVECIRRHYGGEPSPLSDTLARYADFFARFGDFAAYVDCLLLQDLTDEGTRTPQTLDAYLVYRERAIDFIEARNRRIAARVRTADR
jgi:hypothetical protein